MVSPQEVADPLAHLGRGPGLGVNTQALSAAVDAFAATVTGDFEVADVLRQLALSATQVVQLAGAGVMAPTDGALMRLAFSTPGPVQDLERFQDQHQHGPCQDCHRTGQVINIRDLEVEGAWPRYQRYAVGLGLHAMAALPLCAGGRRWGVLEVYRAVTVPLSDEELRALSTLVNLATSYLVVTDARDTARRAQADLAHRAMHDPMTGLPARWVFREQLSHALTRLRRQPGTVGLLFLDLDGLKQVNDTHGHIAGDQLLLTCVRRIRAALRPADILARLGGDEFVVLLEPLSTSDVTSVIAQRVLNDLMTPYSWGPGTIEPSASLGIAFTDDPSVGADDLLAQADAAMYRAKRAGGGRYAFYDPSQAAAQPRPPSPDQLAMELRAALGRGELELYYQPIIDLTDSPSAAVRSVGPVYAVEALVRWHHPEHGLLPANDFIETACRTGLIREVGEWVLQAACHQLVLWDGELGVQAPQQVFVNISTAELVGTHLADQVRQALASSGLAPHRLTLEVTETDVGSTPEVIGPTLEALRELGCQLAIEDFGTGYSSLSRLVGIPAGTLKVDQSFTHAIASSTDAGAVMSAVLVLGQNLHRTVIVEGVEDQQTLQALRRLNVTHLQGNHLGRPVPAEQLAKVCTEH